MAIITINKDNCSLALNVNTLQVVNMLSQQTDYLTDKTKNIYLYYNIECNCIYVSYPASLEVTTAWDGYDKDSVMNWIPAFSNYGNGNCLQGYLHWLHATYGIYTILYGRLDVVGNIKKAAHLIIDANYRCTASICIGIYDVSLSVVGLQQQIAIDLQKVLQECKYIRIYNGKLAVVV